MRDCRFHRRRPNVNQNGCVRHGSEGTLGSYAEIVRDYEKRYRQHAADDLQFYMTRRTLADAVEFAGQAKTGDGKRQPHQRRIPGSVLSAARAELRQCDFSRCSSFHELLQIVDEAIGSLRGIGELTVYDTARRIGAYLRLEPSKVYLHAGTRIGAREMGLGQGTKELEVGQLPVAFRRLTPGEIEDCLCIYKDELKRISKKG